MTSLPVPPIPGSTDRLGQRPFSPARAFLPRHRVSTMHQRRWSDPDDRPLLDAAEAEFDVLVTIAG
ncbi:MAG: hypothetical protein ABI910_18360 [Gemmatimonadota bacterium]